MPGRGRVPKPRDQRARVNKDPIPLTTVFVEPTSQPELPNTIKWHEQTQHWWHVWRDSPLSAHFTDVEWNYLLETAFLQNRFWEGNVAVAGELRLRAAKFGATPEDRARLRIQVTTADEVEDKAEARKSIPTSRSRYQHPQVG